MKEEMPLMTRLLSSSVLGMDPWESVRLRDLSACPRNGDVEGWA